MAFFNRHLPTYLLILLFILIGAGSSWGQGYLPYTDFHYSLLGSRAVGMGGAFSAMENDLIASLYNPATLSTLERTSLYVEMNHVQNRFDDFYVNGGEEYYYEIDHIKDDYYGYGILEVGYVPENFDWNFALSIYNNMDISHNEFYNYRDTEQWFTGEADFDAQLYQIGLSTAGQVYPGVSLGASLIAAVYQIEVNNKNMIYDGFYMGDSTYNNRDIAPSFHLGLLWEVNECLNLGLVYKHDIRVGSLSLFDEDIEKETELPCVIGTGVWYKVLDNLALTADIDLIGYSWLTHEFNRAEVRSSTSYIKSSLEYHLGLEYTIKMDPYCWAFRTGGWYQPPNDVYYHDDLVDGPVWWKEAVDKNDYHFHWDIGVGLLTKYFNFDFAADISDVFAKYILSSTIKF